MSTLMKIGEWLVLLPIWRVIFQERRWQKWAAIGTGAAWILIIVIASAVSGGSEDSQSDAVANVTASPTENATGEPTDLPEPSAAPTEAPTAEPTAEPTPEPTPVQIQGSGPTATDPITPPAPVSIVTMTHSGESNFIVHVFRADSEDLLVNKIGAYTGSRPLFGGEPVVFDVDADGAWTITLEAPATTTDPAFSGEGDSASGLLIEEIEGGSWEIAHTGERNFIVRLHCASGTELIANEIGPVAGSTVVNFGEPPCLWEVEADGSWSLVPR